VAAYFGVRGLTEGDPAVAQSNAAQVLELERVLGISFEEQMQQAIARFDLLVDLGNWIYIWAHWPMVVITLIWLLRSHRPQYLELRNAMIISGLIGLIVFATFPVAPPRLYGSEFVDTVTERSHSYRVLQPPAFVNRYAAVPSLHFGWNLLVAIAWYQVGRWRGHRVAALVMPLAMAWAVVATANHWVFDVIAGGAIALAGLGLERMSRTWRTPGSPARQSWDGELAHAAGVPSDSDREDRSRASCPEGQRAGSGASR
jgi:hypothetical protein